MTQHQRRSLIQRFFCFNLYSLHQMPWVEEQTPLALPCISFPKCYKTVKGKLYSPIILLTALPTDWSMILHVCRLRGEIWGHCQNSYWFFSWFCFLQSISRMIAVIALPSAPLTLFSSISFTSFYSLHNCKLYN